MEILLIDVGALAMFLGYIAIVYWHGVTHGAETAARKVERGGPVGQVHGIPQCTGASLRDERTISAAAGARGVDYLDRESATARSARSSVEIGQCSSQPMQ